METLIKHANGQWTLEELNKVKQADVGPWVSKPAAAPVAKPATTSAVAGAPATPVPTVPAATPAPATPAPATPVPTVPAATPAPASNQGHLGEWWKAPTPGKKAMKPSPDQNYKQLNAIKQKPESPPINYKQLTKPKPTVDNVAEVKARLQEDRRKAGKGPPPPKRGVEEMKARQDKNEAERQEAESIVIGKPKKKI